MSYLIIFAFSSALLCVVFAMTAIIPNWKSWARTSFAAALIFMGGESLASGFGIQAAQLEQSIHWQKLKLISMSFLPALWLTFGLTYARGEAKKFLRKWNFALIAALLSPCTAIVSMQSGLVQVEVDSTIPQTLILSLGWSGKTVHLFVVIGAIATIMCLERTFRSAVGTMRWKVKFMLLGLGTMLVVRVYTSSQTLLYGSLDYRLDTLNSIGLLLGALLILRSMLRKGHFEIEIYPSQAVLQNSFTILIAGLYLFFVGVLAKAVSYIGGDVAFPLKALGLLVALVALGLLLQSDNFRLRTRQFVSRNFNRPMYDYREVWRRFSEQLSAQIDPNQITNALANLIAEIFQALSVSIWIFKERSDALVLSASTGSDPSIRSTEWKDRSKVSEMQNAFSTSSAPIYLDESKEDWASDFAEQNPKQFPEKGGSRLVIPMKSREALQGVIVVSDRVNGMPFTTQEFDILTSVASHTASSLQNAQLSQKLIETKEMEAFQTMATFFVHDLKNAASTINLMVKNLPVHWENEDFRKDALRGIAKTGNRIGKIIEKLSSIQGDLDLVVRPVQVSDVVNSALRRCVIPDRIELSVSHKELSTICQLDANLVESVFTNLVLNATEAIAQNGSIHISINEREKAVYIEIKDNGCGMSQDFLKKELFKPFKTTKKTGLGIGMFQSKMIVEAHKGEILVESEIGKGTTFTVTFPTIKQPTCRG